MLDINVTALIAQGITFILLIFFLKKFAFGPISNTIATRQQEIQDTLNQIAEDRRAMEQSRSDYEARLVGIEQEARDRIAGAVKQAQEEASAIIGKAREEATAQHERALAEIENERRKAIMEIRAQMADLAVAAAGKVLEREINPGVHRDLISSFISQVGAGAE